MSIAIDVPDRDRLIRQGASADGRSRMSLPKPTLEGERVSAREAVDLLADIFRERGVSTRIDDQNRSQDSASRLGRRA
jgi:hypothetical protein